MNEQRTTTRGYRGHGNMKERCPNKSVCENTFLKIYLPSAKKIVSPPSFWCVCARGKQNPAGDAFEMEKGNDYVRDYNIRTAAAVVLWSRLVRVASRWW